MALAFELPEHLPRSGHVQDKSTSVLTKVGQVSGQSLNADLAASWLAELDSAIQDTKSRISKRIQDDLPAFERQLESSMSLKTRLHDLSSSVNCLAESLNDPDTGILPILLSSLSTHRTLAEQTSDAEVTYRALAHLLRTQEGLGVLSALVQQGQLEESAETSGCVQALVTAAPSPLDRAEIMTDIKKRHRALKDRVQEQIGDAYARSIMVSSSPESVSLIILSSTNVPPTSTEISLPAILRSLTSDALSTRLSTLRRDIMSKFVEPLLLSVRSLTSSTGEGSNTLTLISFSPSSSPLQSLQTLCTFLNSNIFPHLPPTHAEFPSTFHAPITTAILVHLLRPSIPSSLSLLPAFLDTVGEGVRFEDALLPTDARDRPIRHWAGDVAGHYERKRREDVMQLARQVVRKQEDDTTIRIEVSLKRLGGASVQPPQGQAGTDESGWDFDGDISDKNVSEMSGSDTNGPKSLSTDAQEHGDNASVEEDASDGWGWGDDADGDADIEAGSSPSLVETPQQNSSPEAEDDPWGNDWDTDQNLAPPPESEPAPPTPQRTPKLAKRLEKFSAKAKGLSASNTPAASPSIATAPKPPPLPPQVHNKSRQRPTPLKKKAEKETYLVSVRAKTTLEIAEGLLREGQELMHSNILSGHLSPASTTPGQLVASAATLVLDMYRALYPVAHSSALAHDPDIAMRWTNDCRFLSDEVASLQNDGRLVSMEDKWTETGERLKILGETSFEDVVVRQQDAVKDILVGVQGFEEVANAERFEECKSAIEQVLREITSVSDQWKVTLTKSAYLQAIGQVVDDALFQVMDNILSLVDIPEADSERLSELCEMLEPLEDLFKDSPDEQSLVGSHVPLWFKFSYLSWLIKGSIADLSYLFDQGMLVDYEIDELVRLLRALFAETPLRENTIAKISKGHPAIVQLDDF